MFEIGQVYLVKGARGFELIEPLVITEDTVLLRYVVAGTGGSGPIDLLTVEEYTERYGRYQFVKYIEAAGGAAGQVRIENAITGQPVGADWVIPEGAVAAECDQYDDNCGWKDEELNVISYA